MVKRRLHDRLSHLISHFPAVALLGPRQVGKTTLALNVAESLPSVYLDWNQAQTEQNSLTLNAIWLTTKTSWSSSTKCIVYRACFRACVC